MANNGKIKELANFIWSIADLLRGDYKQSDYGKIILPFTVLRRLDCVLEPTKQKVLDYLPKLKSMKFKNTEPVLNKVAGFNFHNKSKLDFEKLKADPDNIAANLRNYINGFSSGGREIIEYFSFNDQIARLDEVNGQHPLKEDIREYFEREVLPHVPDAWIDESKTVKGYEINITKSFYKYKPLRSLEEIRTEILELEMQTEGLISEVVKI